MAITLTKDESVRRDGETYSVGDKVYSNGRAKFGVGYIQAIELYGVHFGFRAKITSTICDDAIWVDSRNLTKEIPLSSEEIERLEQQKQKRPQPAKV